MSAFTTLGDFNSINKLRNCDGQYKNTSDEYSSFGENNIQFPCNGEKNRTPTRLETMAYEYKSVDFSELENIPKMKIDDTTIYENPFVESITKKLQTMTIDELIQKCKSNNIGSLSRCKKQELVRLLLDELSKITQKVNSCNISTLKQICKSNNLKIGSSTKTFLLEQIHNFNSSCIQLKFIDNVSSFLLNAKRTM
jgi:hypothetical protein